MHKIFRFLIIVLFESTNGAEYMETNIKLDNLRFDFNVIQTRHKSDITDCAVRCTSRLDCLSIQYQDSTQTCRMFDTIFLTSDGASYENGWRYYLKTGGKYMYKKMFLKLRTGGISTHGQINKCIVNEKLI